ncbi:MAG: DNA repair protein RecN, partial [Flavobacteriales bacterium]|nr:DNA repair protein RecN [Flavobacteriales bacterium]
MLTRLYINNFITIEEIDVNFSKGFTSITGETGSGKSVILDALNLLCGNRLDSSKIINREKKIVIEAEFDISNFNMLDFFDNNEIDYFDTTIIRREINPAGKSRSFINDSPVKLDLLKLFSLNIIDIHSQHESLLLNNEFFQLNFIDDFIKNKDNNYSSMISNYRDQYMVNQRLSDELEELRIKNKIIKDEYENIVFSLNELSEITLNKGEKKQLVNEYNFLKNSSEIKIQLEKTIKLLNIDDNSVIHQLNQILLSLKKIKNYSEKIEEFSKR